MVDGDAMMGGGKSGKKVTVTDDNKLSDIPDGALEIILEQDPEDADIWYLNVGEDEEGKKLYLYASYNSEDEEEPQEPGDDPSGDDDDETPEFDISELLNMFGNSGAGLKVGTKEAVGDSCQASIAITAAGATIKFNVPGKKNTITMGNAMDAMMQMFGSFMKEEETEGDEPGGQEQGQEQGSTFNFNFSMPSFNCVNEDETEDKLPRIFHFVHADEYEIFISDLHWTTLYSDFDVILPAEEENKLAVYTVTAVEITDFGPRVTLEEVESVKGHEPYLVKGVNRDGSFVLRRADAAPAGAPKKNEGDEAASTNLLKVSDATTGDGAFVLGRENGETGLAPYAEGLMGKGHVYLPEEEVPEGTLFIPLDSNDPDVPTAIVDVTRDENTNDRIYDLQGRDVTNATKHPGIYIKGGKKVIVK